MFSTVVIKELKALLISRRFIGGWAACTVLILLSAWIGIGEYRRALAFYETGTSLAEEQVREATSWGRLALDVLRRPTPLEAFVAGTSADIGRSSPISTTVPVGLGGSLYEEDPIFALFRMLDLALIVQVVLSLFAILLTYDVVCGEKERGTLRLALACAVPRARFLAAKLVGCWLGLVVPLAIPGVATVLLALAAGVPLGATEWGRLAGLAVVFVAYLTFWVALGVLVSTLSRRPGQAFLASLVAWVVLIFIAPRAAVVAATRLAPVPSPGEVAGQEDAFARQRFEALRGELVAWTQQQGPPPAAGDEAAIEEARRLATDEFRRRHALAEQEIEANSLRLREDLVARQARQRRLALAISRVSPAAALSTAATRLAGTDAALKERFERSLQAYQTEFATFVTARRQETGDDGRVMITAGGPGGVSVRTPQRRARIDATSLPRFRQPVEAPGTIWPTVAVDLAIVGLLALLAAAAAHVRFLRFDAR